LGRHLKNDKRGGSEAVDDNNIPYAPELVPHRKYVENRLKLTHCFHLQLTHPVCA
jgi:hypothetical protein